MTLDEEYNIKIIVVGDVNTGKTSIIKRLVNNTFSFDYKSTIGVDFLLKIVNYSDNTVVRVQLWDIGGQERFSNMTRIYYKEAKAAIIVCDVTLTNIIESINRWRESIEEVLLNSITIFVFVNKIDLVTEEELEDIKKILNCCNNIVFTSAKNPDICCSNEGFNRLIDTIIQNISTETDKDTIKLETPKKNKKLCC